MNADVVAEYAAFSRNCDGRAVRGRDGGRLIAGNIVGGGITEEVAGKMLPVFAFSVTLPVNRWERRSVAG